MRGKICFQFFNNLEIRFHNLEIVNIYCNVNIFMAKIKSMIIVELKKAQFFYLISKSIKSKTSKLFKPIKYFKKYQNLAIVAVVKEFRLFNINFLSKLKIEKNFYYIKLVWMQSILCNNSKKSFVGCCFDYKSISLKIVNLFFIVESSF